MKVLSLFDGMACGAIAFTKMGLPIDRYVAYEYDEETANASKGRPFGFAALVASHNFPYIEERGDVFKADFAEYEGFDWVIGGSPCTYWSIAQKNNRETEASGLGWELFSQYVRAVHEAKPKYFLYENNKSMSKEIRASIDKAFGFEAVGINSALVSAQNRQRLYWVGKRNDDGTYSKVDVKQPEDKEILLRDILDNSVVMPINVTVDGKAQTIRATCYKDGIRNMVGNNVDRKTCVAEPVCMRYERTDEAKRVRKDYEAENVKHGFHELPEMHPREDGKTNTLSTVLKDNPICEPVRVGDLPNSDGHINGSQAMRIYSDEGKSVNLVAGGGGMSGKTGLYAAPYEYIDYTPREKSHIVINENAIRCAQDKNNASAAESFVNFADRKIGTVTTAHVPKCIEEAEKHPKAQPVYEVRDGLITIKDKQYPIKLADGYYIIRKLTVSECKRLQTVPDWYDFSVISNSQAYKCLGNGWTVDVIVHLIESEVTT